MTMITQRLWIASDLHLGHARLWQNKARQRGWEKQFLTAWNDVVGSDDYIALLGDIAWGKPGYWFGVLQEMPGHKVLLLGNHDHKKPEWYEKFGFRLVVPFNKVLFYDDPLGTIMLSHLPAFPSALCRPHDDKFRGMSEKFSKIFDREGCILNIHGHTHCQCPKDHRCFDASLDCIGNQPITLDQIKARAFQRDMDKNDKRPA